MPPEPPSITRESVHKYPSFLAAQWDSTEVCTAQSVRRPLVGLSHNCPQQSPYQECTCDWLLPLPCLCFYSVTMLPLSSIMCPNFLSQGCSRENLTGDILLNPSHSQRKENPNYALYFLPTICQSLFRTRNNRYFWENCVPPSPNTPVFTLNIF